MKVLVELEIKSVPQLRAALSVGCVHALTEVHILDIASKPEEFTTMFGRVLTRHGLVKCPRPMVRRVSRKILRDHPRDDD